MIRPYVIPAWVYFLLGLGFASAMFFGIYSFAELKQIPRFIGISQVESGDITNPLYEDTLIAGCTNKTIGIQTRKYQKETIIAHGCPDSRNVCSEFICNEGRICEEVIKSNATCSEDFDCTGNNERCDLSTCSCVPDGSICTSDSQCLDFNATTTCIETFCDLSDGQCKTRYINETMDSCENDSSCGDDLICRNCMCIPMPEVNVTACGSDSDCTDYTETSSCIEAFCNMTTLACATRFQDMSYDCDGSCPTGQVCQDCVCEDIPTGLDCQIDDDCIDFELTSDCVEAFCNSGRCATRYIGSGNCDSDSTCTGNDICFNCTCQAQTSCQSTGYDMQPLTSSGFSCGIDVAIDGDVLVTLCTSDPSGNPELNLISFVKNGSMWTEADNELSGIYRLSNIPFYVPALDMDGGFIVVYGNNMNTPGSSRSLEIFSIDGSGIITFYQRFDVNDNDGSIEEPSGDVCIQGDNIVIADVMQGGPLGGNSPTLFQNVAGTWTHFPSSFTSAAIGGSSPLLCDINSDNVVFSYLASVGGTPPLLSQHYKQYRIASSGSTTQLGGWEIFGMQRLSPLGTTYSYPVYHVILESMNGNNKSYLPIGNYVPLSDSQVIMPLMYPNPDGNDGNFLGAYSPSLGSSIRNRRTPMASSGTNALIGNVLYSNSQLQTGGVFIDLSNTGLDEPVLIAASLSSNQPAYGFFNDDGSGDYSVLANHCS